MDITIKPLSPELAKDYFDFFEQRAFTDESPYRCYCQVYQMTKEQLQAASEDVIGLDPGQIARKVAEQQIQDGALRGYLAYANGMSVGWCNANDRANYPEEPAFDMPFHAPAANREKAVICFEIAPEYRRMGIASALLDRVINDAKTEGFKAVVGFPVARSERFEWDYPGPLQMYEKAGFIKTSPTKMDEIVVMRKELG
ncbi:MAG: GNAT family N-acetyltransferase [Coriobacteriia bacterium]|nr:GNAT family N-acetyltransferase [Coriobacteriia bacterium]